VHFSDDPFEVLDLQDELQTRYRLPYFTITPTFSICPNHGYLPGRQENCPSCGAVSEVYSRVVGYLRPVNQWNEGKVEEFKQRKTFKIGQGVVQVRAPQPQGVTQAT
jgi:ribonucleoside-triphosphate reductase (formate)